MKMVYCLTDRLLTNQIALLLPVRGRTEFGKMFGIKGMRFLSSPPPLPSYSPPSLLLPNFLAHPRRAPSLARFSFACSISARPEKGKESAATQTIPCKTPYTLRRRNLKTQQMFSVHSTPEKFDSAKVIGLLRFLSQENSGREIT